MRHEPTWRETLYRIIFGHDTPGGKRFDECYDLETVQPVQEYLDLYERCKENLSDMGLDY